MSVVLFVREDLLKATHKELKWIESFTDKRGHVHRGHHKHVLVADDHDNTKVATGQGSFYQKVAHKNAMADIPNFQSLDIDHQANIILHHATGLQAAASASAAMSGFKASILAGKVPTTAQYLAMANAPSNAQGKVVDACVAAIGEEKYTQLLLAASAKANQPKGKTSEPQTTQAVQASQKEQAFVAPGASVDPAVEPAKPAAPAQPGVLAQTAVGADLPPKVKAKLDDWAVDGYVDRLQDAVNDHGSNPAYQAYAKNLLVQLQPTQPAAMGGPDFSAMASAPVPENIKAVIDKIASVPTGNVNGAKMLLGQVVANNAHNPHIAAYAQAKLEALAKPPAKSPTATPLHTFTGDGLESYVSQGTGVNKGKFGVSLKDTDAGMFVPSVSFYPTENAAIKSAKAAAGVKDGPKAPTSPKFKDLNHALVATQWGKMFESGDHQGLKDSLSKFAGNMQANPALGNDPDTLALMKYALELGSALPGAAAAGPKEGDTKTENGKTYKLQGSKWHRTDSEQEAGAAVAVKESTPEAIPAKNQGVAVDPAKTFYHYGSHTDASTLQPLTFFAADKKSAESYEANGKGTLHAVTLNIKNAANQDQVKAAAAKLGFTGDSVAGLDDDYVTGFEFLSPHLNKKVALAVMGELKSQGFDGAWFSDDFDLGGGGIPGGSTVIFSSDQAALKAALSATQAMVDANVHAADAATVAAMAGGSHYQKEAVKKLKSEHGPAWDAMHPSKQLDLAHAKYQALQGAASQSAAVSGWKKHMLAGQVPTPSEVKAMAAFDTTTPDKAVKVMNDVQAVIGMDKYIQLVTQAHAKAAKAPAAAPVAAKPTEPAKVFVTTPPVVAAKPQTLADKPAYDHMAQSVSSKMSHSLPSQKTFHKLAAQDWMAANPDKGAEMYGALVSLKLSHLAALVGPSVSPAATPSAAAMANMVARDPSKAAKLKAEVKAALGAATKPANLINEAMAKLSKPLQNLVTVFGLEGDSASTLSVDNSLMASEVSAFMAATPDEKSDVVSAISALGPHKLKLFMDWVSDQNAKAAAPAPAPSVPVASQVFYNMTPGHNKFWSVSTHGSVMKTTYGKIGTQGSTTTKDFASSAAAAAAAKKLQSEKVTKGYANSHTGVHQYESAAAQPPASPTATPAAAAKPASTKGVTVASTPGWTHQASDGSLSGAPSLTCEDASGYTYYVAHTGDVYQVGVIDARGNPMEHEDFSDPEEAAAQMGQLIMGNNAGLPFLLAADIQKLDPDAGPKDGDTKQGADGTLVFKGGYWRKVPVKKFTKVEVKALLLSQLGTQLSGNDASKMAFKAAAAGDAPGMVAAHIKAVDESWPNTAKKIKFLAQAMGVSVDGTPVASPTAMPAAVPKPAAAAQPVKAGSQAKVFVTAPPGKPGVTAIDGWAQTGQQKGSNPGGKFMDKSGQEWYCKFPASEDHVKNELLASKLYKAAGVDVPTLRMVEKDGKIGIASKIVDGVTKVGAGIKNAPGAMEGFAVDAWLGNYDSVGTGHDNLLKTKDGKAVRIDLGGSLLYRAMGAPKGDSFGVDVVEIDAMRDPSKNQFGASVFSGITKEKLTESVALVLDIPDDVILQLVSKFGPGDDAQRAALAAKLIARKKDLAKKYPAANLIVNPPKPDQRNLPVDTSKLPKKLDFMNWKGAGQGLSGTAKINEVNQAAIDQIYSAAMKGDFVALKKLKFHIIDKATGVVKDGALFGDHPSQHVKDFYSTVLDYMEVIANPAAKKAKAWDVGDYSDVNELSDGFKAHYYGVTVGQVPANQRLGFWISLGQTDAAQSFMPKRFEYTSTKDNAKGKASLHGMTAILKKWMAAVKGSGSYNVPYREGKEIDNSGLNARDVLTDAYAHAVEFEEGTRITKDITFPDAMMKQMMALAPGHVFQNPGSMCCSLKENWSWSGTNAKLHIVYAKGAKALYNIGIGNHNGEGEITTIPGQRFMLIKMETKNPSKPEFTLLMLPPDDVYVANIKPK